MIHGQRILLFSLMIVSNMGFGAAEKYSEQKFANAVAAYSTAQTAAKKMEAKNQILAFYKSAGKEDQQKAIAHIRSSGFAPEEFGILEYEAPSKSAPKYPDFDQALYNYSIEVGKKKEDAANIIKALYQQADKTQKTKAIQTIISSGIKPEDLGIVEYEMPAKIVIVKPHPTVQDQMLEMYLPTALIAKMDKAFKDDLLGSVKKMKQVGNDRQTITALLTSDPRVERLMAGKSQTPIPSRQDVKHGQETGGGIAPSNKELPMRKDRNTMLKATAQTIDDIIALAPQFAQKTEHERRQLVIPLRNAILKELSEDAREEIQRL